MRKTKKLPKVSMNTLLLFIDIPILILLNKNLYADIVRIYISIRLVMVALILLKVLIKVLKTTFIMFRESGVVELLFSMITSVETNLQPGEVFRKSKNIFLFELELIVLMGLFEYSMSNTLSILSASNDLTVFMAAISLNFILALIRDYINKRCDYMINTLEKKENLAL